MSFVIRYTPISAQSNQISTREDGRLTLGATAANSLSRTERSNWGKITLRQERRTQRKLCYSGMSCQVTSETWPPPTPCCSLLVSLPVNLPDNLYRSVLTTLDFLSHSNLPGSEKKQIQRINTIFLQLHPCFLHLCFSLSLSPSHQGSTERHKKTNMERGNK